MAKKLDPVQADRLLLGVQKALGIRGTLHDFVKMAWHLVEPGAPFLDNWHVGAICEHLEAVTKCEIRNLIINVPPGCMKSLTTQVFWHPWVWIRDPGHRFISASFDASLTLRDANKSLAILQSDWFLDRWGDRVMLPSDPAGADYSNSAGGFRFSTSIEGKMTGRHGDTLIVDDPLKPQAVNKTTLEKVERWWKETVPTRFRDPKTSRRVIIMQRLHENDLAGLAMREGGYEVLRLPMRYEPKTASYTKVGGDLRTREGELLWPERFPEVEVTATETTMGSRISAAQLQQRPAPEAGAVFQRQWFRHWTPVGAPVTPGVPIKGLPAKFDLVVQSWDCTFKGLDTSDYVVGQVWARSAGEFYLLDQVRDRMTFSGTLAAIRALTRKWPRAMAKLIEDKANGSAVMDVLRKEIPGLIAVEPEGGKEARANAVAPLFEAGNVYHPDPACVPWVDAHREELATFPVGVNDDSVDACTQALLYLYKRKSNLAAAMKNAEEMIRRGVRIV